MSNRSPVDTYENYVATGNLHVRTQDFPWRGRGGRGADPERA
jgi:hypothetical protein